ncbi:stress response protein [Perilla frutescens var. frutescens]|nr:stress response protein [Perilla frutescens var. frutescens]
MIKRRFYRFEHGNRDDPSGSSSSSSESEVEVEPVEDTDIEEEEEEDDDDDDDDDEDEDDEVKGENVASDVREKGEASSSSGYESEDSSVNEVNLDSSGLPTSDDDVGFPGVEGNSLPTSIQHSPKKDETDFDMADCVLKCKSVFKCRLCPRIVCLSEETLKAHLSSKKHARSEKLRKEGRLKLMLNDDGKIEGEVHSENHDTTPVSRQKSAKPNRKGKGRWKQKKRPRQNDAESRKAKSSTEKREKRRKNDD